jgi:hypothetical protein
MNGELGERQRKPIRIHLRVERIGLTFQYLHVHRYYEHWHYPWCRYFYRTLFVFTTWGSGAITVRKEFLRPCYSILETKEFTSRLNTQRAHQWKWHFPWIWTSFSPTTWQPDINSSVTLQWRSPLCFTSSTLRWKTAETRKRVICSCPTVCSLFQDCQRFWDSCRLPSMGSLQDCLRARAALSSWHPYSYVPYANRRGEVL